MDTLSVIKTKIAQFEGHQIHEYLISILGHLAIAERHYSAGITSSDTSLFNDVIYRCNQAFEGILREAYGLYSGKDKTKPQTHEIEEYFEKNSILRTRVIDLLRNYRTAWRNPSTHNYWLTFDSSESFVSILSIQAFVVVLLDQITQKFYFEAQKNSPATVTTDQIPKNIVDAFVFAYDLLLPSISLQSHDTHKPTYSDFSRKIGEFVGELAALAREFNFRPDYVVVNKQGERVAEFDLLIESRDYAIPVEFKFSPSAIGTMVRIAEDRLVVQMLKCGYKTGILCYLPTKPASKSHHILKNVGLDQSQIELNVVFPENRELERNYKK